MEHHCNPQTLTFDEVNYPLEEVNVWLNNPDVASLAFYSYFPAGNFNQPTLQLSCYALSFEGTFLNPDNPDILASVAGGQSITEAGPIKLNANMISTTALKAYLEAYPSADALRLRPIADDLEQVFYDITAYPQLQTKGTLSSNTLISEAELGEPEGGSLPTNPSPPAPISTPVEV